MENPPETTGPSHPEEMRRSILEKLISSGTLTIAQLKGAGFVFKGSMNIFQLGASVTQANILDYYLNEGAITLETLQTLGLSFSWHDLASFLNPQIAERQ